MTDWNEEAVEAANYVFENLMECCGAFRWKEDVSFVFGKDDYPMDECWKRHVELVRQHLGEKVLGFGVDDFRGTSWAIIVASVDTNKLTEMVWDCWRQACCEGVRKLHVHEYPSYMTNDWVDSPEEIECCICLESVSENETCNALPIQDGRCCQRCNDEVVIPRRQVRLDMGLNIYHIEPKQA